MSGDEKSGKPGKAGKSGKTKKPRPSKEARPTKEATPLAKKPAAAVTAPTTKRSGAVSASQVRADLPPDVPSAADSLAAAKAFLIGAPAKKSAPKKPPRAAAPKMATPKTIEVAEDPESDELDRMETIPVPRVEKTPEVDSAAPTPLIPRDAPSGERIADEIRALEERLDRMIDEASQRHLPTADVPPTPPPPSYSPPSIPPPAASSRAVDGAGETVFDTARELLSTDFYLRKWGRMGMRNRSEEVDDFGFDPVYEHKVRGAFNFLYEKYFRVECEGIDKIPAEGRCLLVSNHSGTLPFDGIMLKTAVKREHPKQRDVRWLAEDFIFHFPFLGAFSNRVGAVRACQENAERLLRQEALVAVFPEGVKGIGKLWKQRYQLQRFGRGGFIKLCLRTQTPIVPVAVVGAEETNPLLFRVEVLSKVLGLPYLPVTPTFPALGLLGLAPAPTKWRILFGDVITLDGYGAEAADDEILVGRLAERVRATIQAMLDRAVGERRSVWFG